MPLRRYQTPSFVRQTSSASIRPPLVSIITGLPPWRFPIPGPLVDTGSLVERVCAVETFSGDDRGEGAIEGDGEGETSTDGDGVAEGAATGSTVTGVSVAAAAFSC